MQLSGRTRGGRDGGPGASRPGAAGGADPFLSPSHPPGPLSSPPRSGFFPVFRASGWGSGPRHLPRVSRSLCIRSRWPPPPLGRDPLLPFLFPPRPLSPSDLLRSGDLRKREHGRRGRRCDQHLLEAETGRGGGARPPRFPPAVQADVLLFVSLWREDICLPCSRVIRPVATRDLPREPDRRGSLPGLALLEREDGVEPGLSRASCRTRTSSVSRRSGPPESASSSQPG